MKWNGKVDGDGVLVSHTGHALVRPVSFKYALDVVESSELWGEMFSYAGARRFCFNHHVARIKTNLTVRSSEREAGVAKDEMTPSLSWSAQSFINEFNAWKNGKLDTSPIDDAGARGLPWRSEISADVFECASVDAARAFKNYSESAKGARAGIRVGFPRFKKKHKTTPTFRLRSKSAPGETAPVRFTGNGTVKVPRLGELRIHGSVKKARRMIEAGRFHVYSATFSFERGRWWISVNGKAAVFHHERRSTKHRNPTPVGVDLGVKSLAVAATVDGAVVEQFEGVKALQQAQRQLRRANKALARTTPGSKGNAAAKKRLNRLHGRVAAIRNHVAHEFARRLVTQNATVTVEDLHVAGMVRLRSLARAVSDAGMGNLLAKIAYKAEWYGCSLHVADRWYPSSKVCSGCGEVKGTLLLSERIYRCEHCGLVLDRDVNAAINLARWPDRDSYGTSPPLGAAA